MSRENARRFMDLAMADPQVKQALAESETLDAVVSLAVRLGAERGLPFEARDLEACLRPQPRSGEPLSDDQVDQVAGGSSSSPKSAGLWTEMLSNVAKTRSEISMTFARNARG
jgi:predicted ribosomally synthesized peptide with nif11-like leader